MGAKCYQFATKFLIGRARADLWGISPISFSGHTQSLVQGTGISCKAASCQRSTRSFRQICTLGQRPLEVIGVYLRGAEKAKSKSWFEEGR
jgi:hypothetical protein